ncbi:hypothetical protein PG996_008734 [Apiospora saccharicola]|uniref:Uncharacterized protein n=1 Tax=Apiospora saccharicola TaxID=335842 RepID=A0ABR1UYT5_9PEZI
MRLSPHYLACQARQGDEYYTRYIEDRRVEEGYAPVEALEPVGLPLMPTLPMIDTRLMRFQKLTVSQFLKSEWGRSIGVCEADCGP